MMQAGTYYIGDLCYVMCDEEWDEFFEEFLDDGEHVLSDGRRVASYSTMYGDGVYEPNTGASLGVDAGLIGCIKLEDIKGEFSLAELAALGTVVRFAEHFTTDSTDGTIRFGHVIVPTAD